MCMKSKMFALKDIFNIYKGKRLTKEDMIEGETNYISAISDDNGIRQKIGQEPIFEPNCITINYNGSVGETFYQIKPFWASDDVNVLYLKNQILNEKIAMYLITVIKANKYKFSYGRKWTLDKMLDTEIPLPVNDNDDIDWNLIEQAVDNLKNKHISTNIEISNEKLNLSNWKQFQIKEHFDCEICESEDFGNVEKGLLKFIGRTSFNNGVQGFVNSDIITNGKCITLGMVGSFSPFWQEDDFVASQNILNLRNENLNKYNALFVISCLKKLIKGKHSYNRPIQKQKFINETISLPTKNNEPDWQFMEDYIKSLPYADRI